MGHKSLPAQFQIHVGKGRLIAIQAMESHLGLHGQGVRQFLPPFAEYGQFAALDVDLQQIDPVDFLDGVQPSGVDRCPVRHPGQPREVDQQVQLSLVGFQQTGKSGRRGQLQGVRVAVANGIGQVALMRPGPSAQFGERLELRLEAGHPAQAGVHQQPVGRIAIDRIRADVHHVDRRPPIGWVGGGDIAVEGGGQQVEDLPSKLRGPGGVGGRVGCVAQRTVN